MVDNSELTALDRCARCAGQAQARTMHEQVDVPGEALPLLWCAHHFRENRDRLSPLLVFMTPEIAKSKVPVPHG